MKLATITHDGRTKAALVDADGKTFWPLEDLLGRAVPDLGALVGELEAIKSTIKPTGAGLPPLWRGRHGRAMTSLEITQMTT